MADSLPEAGIPGAPVAAYGVELLRTVGDAVHQRVVGQTDAVEALLVALLTGGHVLLEGLPGLAKTLMVRTLAEAVHTGFSRIQFTPDLLPSDIVGTPIFDQSSGQFRVHKGPIFSNIVLADEINRAPPKVQAALLEAMEAFVVGIRETPTFDVFSGEAGLGAPVVGSWNDVVAATSAKSAGGEPYSRVTVASRPVFVTTVLMLEDVVSGISPRPPADVVGGSWDLSSVLPALVLSILLIGLVSVGVRDWLDARATGGGWEPGPVETPDVWRQRALEQLDGVLSEGLHQSGRPREFYEGLSEVVRHYVERFDDGWDRSLTATELMRLVSASRDWMDPAGLSTAMGFAEVVKFGKTRPSPEKADDDWRVVRGWVEASQEAPAFRALVADAEAEAT